MGVTLPGRRIGAHLNGISTSMRATAPRYREWAEDKRITIMAYSPEPVLILNRKIPVHRAIEAALIIKFRRPGESDWFVART
jgi:hypothetical protein